MVKMGFRDARSKAIDCLKRGSYQHEAREEIEVKNLLAIGDISPQKVIDMLKTCGGNHHSSSPHHIVKGVQVHVIKPDNPSRWYIKFYFVDPDIPELMFISVHPEEAGEV